MKITFRSTVALIIVILSLSGSQPVHALDVSSYFNFSYTIDLSKTQVLASEAFQAAITAKANCTDDLPFPISEAEVTGRLVAVYSQGINRVVLVPTYKFSIKPFPDKKSESMEQTLRLDIMFPEAAQPGKYDLVAELVEARVKSLFWFTVTSYLPQNMNLGSVTVLSSSNVTKPTTIQPTTRPPASTNLPPTATVQSPTLQTTFPILPTPTAPTTVLNNAQIGSSLLPSLQTSTNNKTITVSSLSSLDWLLVGSIIVEGVAIVILVFTVRRLRGKSHL